jgi:uncharacterized protein YprB with RNaseH-like and TPR domain
MDFGRILCIGYKWLDEKRVYIPAIQLPGGGISWNKAEKTLVKEFIDVLKEADAIVTYNGKRYDWPALQAKALHYGFGALPNVPHIDLYYTVKSNLKISRKSLQNAAYFLNLSNEKTPVVGNLWLEAQSGNKTALREIIKHCRADVLILEELYYKIRPLVRTHPRVNGYGNCRYCGSKALNSRGKQITKTKNPQRRVQCQSCGGWDTRPLDFA